MMNMYSRPRLGSPTRYPAAPRSWPNCMTQVGLAWMPSLCSMDAQRTSLRSPSEPSALTSTFGTMKSEMPLTPAGAPSIRASIMDDVVRVVVLPEGDEDLLPEEPVMIALRHRAGPHQGQVGAGLRLRQHHGAGPLAACQSG